MGEAGEVVISISPVTTLENAQELVNAFIAEMQENGTLAEMDNRWNADHDYTMPEIAEA